jgi:carboxymethylenebutenolidase
VLLRPDGDAALPGVLFYTDLFGLRPAQLDLARGLAQAGFVVLAPNLFHRTGEPPFFPPGSYPDFTKEEVRQKAGVLSGPLTPDVQARDASAYVDFLSAQPGVAPGKLGVVGHCFSGSMALRTAAARPDRIGVCASFHGGRLFTADPTSPHLSLPGVKARLYFGHADNDRSMPAEAIAGLEAALRAWGGTFESEVYPGAVHGWTSADAPVHDTAAAQRAAGKLQALMATLRS